MSFSVECASQQVDWGLLHTLGDKQRKTSTGLILCTELDIITSFIPLLQDKFCCRAFPNHQNRKRFTVTYWCVWEREAENNWVKCRKHYVTFHKGRETHGLHLALCHQYMLPHTLSLRYCRCKSVWKKHRLVNNVSLCDSSVTEDLRLILWRN